MALLARYGTGARAICLGAIAALAVTALTACGSDSGTGELSAEACEAYPTKPIDFVVPYAAGGGFDAWARLIAPYLQNELGDGAEVRVTNVDGGGGMRAMNQISAAPPDGSQIVLSEPGFPTVNQILGRTGDDFDITKLTYLAQITVDPQVFTAVADSDVATVSDLAGSPIRHAGQDISPIETIVYDEMGIDAEFILHEATSETFLALERGDAEATVTSLSSVIDYLKAGRVKPILFIGTEKIEPGLLGYEFLKETQTADDIGHPELAEVLEQYRVIAAPSGLPTCIKDKLEGALLATLENPEFVEKAEAAALRVIPGSASDTQARVERTYGTLNDYSEVLKTAIGTA